MHIPQIFFSPAAVLTGLTGNQAFHPGSCSAGGRWEQDAPEAGEGGQQFAYQNMGLFIYRCTYTHTQRYVENWKLICSCAETEGEELKTEILLRGRAVRQ